MLVVKSPTGCLHIAVYRHPHWRTNCMNRGYVIKEPEWRFLEPEEVPSSPLKQCHWCMNKVKWNMRQVAINYYLLCGYALSGAVIKADYFIKEMT